MMVLGLVVLGIAFVALAISYYLSFDNYRSNNSLMVNSQFEHNRVVLNELKEMITNLDRRVNFNHFILINELRETKSYLADLSRKFQYFSEDTLELIENNNKKNQQNVACLKLQARIISRRLNAMEKHLDISQDEIKLS